MGELSKELLNLAKLFLLSSRCFTKPAAAQECYAGTKLRGVCEFVD